MKALFAQMFKFKLEMSRELAVFSDTMLQDYSPFLCRISSLILFVNRCKLKNLYRVFVLNYWLIQFLLLLPKLKLRVLKKLAEFSGESSGEVFRC